MAEFSKLIITNRGQTLIAKMIAGAGNIDFTKICTSGAQYEEGQLVDLTSLSDVKQTSLISKVTRTNEVAIKVEAAFTNTELTEGYYMNAIGLYAVDPDVGEILYAVTIETSSNCYMPPYNGVTVSGAYVQLITTVGNAESVTLEVDAAAVATIGDVKELQEQIDDLKAYLEEDSGAGQLISEHNADAAAHPAILAAMAEIAATASIKLDITIPMEGWVEDGDTEGVYGLHVDIPHESITEEMLPILTILPAYYELAKTSTLCGTSRTIAGALRVYAQSPPTADIGASLALLGSSGDSGSGKGGASNYVLPVATAYQLGGVKIGEGITVAADGTISVNEASLLDDDTVATEAAIEEMLDNVFGDSTEDDPSAS